MNYDILLKSHKTKSNQVKRLIKKLKTVKSGMKESHINKAELIELFKYRAKAYREYYGQYDEPSDYEYGRMIGKADLLEDMANELAKGRGLDYI